MTGFDTINSPQHSEDTPRAYKWCCLPLVLCGRIIALCPPHLVCRLSSAIYARNMQKLLVKELPRRR